MAPDEYGSKRIWRRDRQLWRMRRRDQQLQTNMVARSIAVENEVTRSVASNKYGSSLGLVRVGSKERRAKILSREEREEIERERKRER